MRETSISFPNSASDESNSNVNSFHENKYCLYSECDAESIVGLISSGHSNLYDCQVVNTCKPVEL